MCMWFGFNQAINFCHFSNLLTLSFFAGATSTSPKFELYFLVSIHVHMINNRMSLDFDHFQSLIKKEDICRGQELKEFLGYTGDGHIAFVRKVPENVGPRIDQVSSLVLLIKCRPVHRGGAGCRGVETHSTTWANYFKTMQFFSRK